MVAEDACAPDKKVIKCISRIASAFGERFMESLVYRDPQFIAIKNLALKIDEYSLYKLVIYNSLVSYRLRETGEEYWTEFAREVKLNGDPIDEVAGFIKARRALAVNSKLKRLEALKGQDLRLSVYLNHPGALYKDLMKIYGFKYSKTAALAVKMLCYAALAKGRKVKFPHNVPIPVDSRVLRTSYNVGLIGRSCKKPEKVAHAWDAISRSSKIPSLLLDVFVWGLIEGGWGRP